MSSTVDIQIVSPPNLERIENFLKDEKMYRETIEFSANFNTRLCIERRLRLPFLDPQTGVAQNHSQLFVNKRQRMPGFRQGQLYTYPSARWRKSRRQYLTKMYRFPERPFQSLRKEHESIHATSSAPMIHTGLLGNNGAPIGIGGGGGGVGSGTSSSIVGSGLFHDVDFNGSSFLEESSSLGAIGGDTSDSNSQHHHQPHQFYSQQQQQLQLQQQQQLKEELPKEWFYDDIDINDVDSLEEPKSPADDEYDYDPRYGSKKRRKRRASKKSGMLLNDGFMCGGITGNGSGGIGGGLGGGSGGGGSGAGRRRSGAGRGKHPMTSVVDNSALSHSHDSLDGGGGLCGGGSLLMGDVIGTPTTSGRRPRGQGTRGRRRTTKTANANGGVCDPPSPAMPMFEPPSFETAAAAVGGGIGVDDTMTVGVDELGELRNYRKFL